MALYLTHPRSMNLIINRGDIFVNGDTVYIAKLSGYPCARFSIGDNVFHGIFYTKFDMTKGCYSFPFLRLSSEQINEVINGAKDIDYSDNSYYYYHKYYLESRLPLPKGLICLIDDKYYVTKSACTLTNLLSNVTEIPITTNNNLLGWTYRLKYTAGDCVAYDGYIYTCLKDIIISKEPPDGVTEHTYWSVLAEARTTKLDYVWPYQLLVLSGMISFNKDDTFISNFISHMTAHGAKYLPIIADKYNGVERWLNNDIPILQRHGIEVHGSRSYHPKIDDWNTLLSTNTYIGEICIGCNIRRGFLGNGPGIVSVSTDGTQLSNYCPYLGSETIIPPSNYISPSTVDAYYAGQVFSDGTYIYFVWTTQVNSLSSVSVRVPNISIINKDMMFFAPPTDWFSAKYKREVDEINKVTGEPTGHKIKQTIMPGASIGLAADIFTNVVGTNINQTPPTCSNLAHSNSGYVYRTKANDENEVHLPYANVKKLRSVILTDYNYLVVNNIREYETTYKNGVSSGSLKDSRKDIRYACEGKFVGDFTIDYSMVTDAETDSNNWSTRALADVYYVLKDDNKYGNIDKWLDDETYTAWCFRINICTKEIVSMNSDTEQYVGKYGINSKKKVSIKEISKGVSVQVSTLKGFDSLPQKMREALKNETIHIPQAHDPDVPEKVYKHSSSPSTIDLPDPTTKKPMAKAERQPDGTYKVRPNIKKGDEDKEEKTAPCALDGKEALYVANEDGGSWDGISKSMLATYYNHIPVYSSKESAEALGKTTYFYFNSVRKVIFHENGADVKAVGDETANGEAVSFYLDCLYIISKYQVAEFSPFSIYKGTYWIYNGNVYKANDNFTGTAAPKVNDHNFTWVGKYLNDANSCNNVSNLPILGEDEIICDVKAGNKVILDDKDNTGIIIDVVSPAPKGQLKLDNQIIIGKVKKDTYNKEATLENGVDANYRENSVFVTDTYDTDVSTAEYGQGTLFYIENAKTAYYATKTCTYEEIYKIYPVDYYVYKNNDECRLPHGIKYLIYKDTNRNEELKIYKRKDYAIVDLNSPEYYSEGDDIYRKVDDIAERDKTADKLVARFSNNILVWLEDKDKGGKPDSNCKDYGIYDNDILIWYDTTFQTLHENVYYVYKDNIYRTLSNKITYKMFGDLNYSGLYGQLYAQGKMLIWYCPPVINLIEGAVFKYGYDIYVANENITVEDWKKVDISKLAVTKIGFVELHTEDCKTIYDTDIVLYDTEYTQCYTFNIGEKVDITSSLLVDKDILNEVSNETIIKVTHPTNIKEITKSPESHTIVATKNILDASGTYRWLYHSFDKTAEIKGNFIYNKEDESIYFVENICKVIKIVSKLLVDYYVYKNNDKCRLPHGIKYLIYKDSSRNERLHTLLKKGILDSEMAKSYADYCLDGDNIYKFSDNKLVARFSNDVLVFLEDKDKKGKPDSNCKDCGIYDNDEFVWYDTTFKTLHKNVFYTHNDKVYLTGNEDVTDDKFGDLNYSSLYGELYAQGKMLIWYCPPVMKFIKGTVFLYNYIVYVADEDIVINDLNKFNIEDVKVTKIGFVDLHTDDCKVVYGDIVLYDTEYPQCYIFNVNEKVDITVPLLVDTHVFNSISTETIVQVKELGNITTVTKNVENNTIIATKNILDESNEYRWLYHTYDKTAETKNHYIYDKDKDIIYFVEDICTTIEKLGYNYNLMEFICPIPCKMPYGISHKIYRLTGMYNNNMYINRIFIYYKEEHARPESYFLDGDFVYYKDKDGKNTKFGKYVNGDLVAYNCYIDKDHSEDLFKIIGLYEESLDLFFIYATAVSKIFSGVIFLDESNIYIATTNIVNVSNINSGNAIKLGTMTCEDNIPIFDSIYIDTPTLYYVDGNTVYRLIAKKDSVQPWRVSVGAKGYFRLNIIPHIEEFALNINEYPKNCCYTLRIGDLIYTGSDYSNPKIGDKIYEMYSEVCANTFDVNNPKPGTVKEICYYVYIDCLGKIKLIYKYYEDSEYINKMFVEIKNKDKDIYNIYLYKCYTSEIDNNKYCVYEDVCSQVGCMRPVELTADIPVKLPDYIGVTDQRVYAKILDGNTRGIRGCDMDINTWGLYKIEIGNSTTARIFNYNENYIYTWSLVTHEFNIKDKTTGNLIFNKGDCYTFSDLDISLDVISSCNFILVVEDKTVDSGLILAHKQTVIETATKEKYSYGVDNTYYADRVRQYNKDDVDNPTHNTYNVMSLVDTEEAFIEEQSTEHTSSNIENDGSASSEDRMGLIMDNVFNKYAQTTYMPPTTKMLPNNYVYLADRYMPFTAIDTKKKLRITQIKLTIVLSELSICLYNMLLSIQRPEETVNNRQIYEPWLVWGFYNIIYSKGTAAVDVPIIYPIFDLSPVYD